MSDEENQNSDSAGQPAENIPAPKMVPQNKRVLILIIAGVTMVLYTVTASSQGWWPFEKKNQESRIKNQGGVSVAPNPFADRQTYRNEEYGFEVKYPSQLLKLADKEGGVRLTHSVPYKHSDSCNLSGLDVAMLEDLYDFSLAIGIENKDMKELAKDPRFYSARVLVENNFKTEPGFIDEVSFGTLSGYKVTMGAEGCGTNDYFFPVADNMTVIAENSFSELDLRSVVPGTLILEEEERLLGQILSTFKFIGAVYTSDWQTYRNEEFGFEFRYPSQFIAESENSIIDFHASDYSGISIDLEIKDGELKKDSIVSTYGTIPLNRLKESIIDGKASYSFTEGDAGCGGLEYRIPLSNKNHLSLVFSVCGSESEPDVFILDKAIRVLSTFKFIK